MAAQIHGSDERVYSSRGKDAAVKRVYDKKCAVDYKNSYATENILRNNCDKEIKADPGNKMSILGKYRKKGR